MVEFIAQLANRACRLAESTAGRFARRQDGGAAVEFGLVAAPFLALLFAIMETAIVFFAGQALETAAADSCPVDHDRAGADPELRRDRVQECGLREDLRAVRLSEWRLCRRANVFVLCQRHHAQSGRRPGQLSEQFPDTSPAGPATSWSCGCSTSIRSMSRSWGSISPT